MDNILPKPKRKESVIVEDFLYYEEGDKQPTISNLAFYIWTDKKYISEITKMDGITAVIPAEMPGRTIIMIDKRYEIEDIKNAVIQYIKFSEGEEIHWSKNQLDKLEG